MILLDDKAAAIAKLPVLTGKSVQDADALAKTGTTDNHPFELSPSSHPVTMPVDVTTAFRHTEEAGEISNNTQGGTGKNVTPSVTSTPDFNGFHWTCNDRATAGHHCEQKTQIRSKPLENGEVLRIILQTTIQEPRWWNGIHAGFKNP